MKNSPAGTIRAAVRRRVGRRLGIAAVAATAAIVPVIATTAPAHAATGFTATVTPSNNPFLDLDISGASAADGAGLIDWPSTGGGNQVFTFSLVNGNYEIINGASGKCLYADGIPGDQIVQWPCNGSLNEQWSTYIAPGGLSPTWIQSAATGLFMDVNGNSSAQGTKIVQWYWNGGSNQKFYATAV